MHLRERGYRTFVTDSGKAAVAESGTPSNLTEDEIEANVRAFGFEPMDGTKNAKIACTQYSPDAWISPGAAVVAGDPADEPVSPNRDGWRSVRGIEELGLPSGAPARFAPPESADRLASHWNQGVRAFDDRHFWLSPIDLAAEQTAEELEARIVAIARRERMIAVLLPRLRSDPLRDRRDALANEAKRLVVEREALSRALASHAA
ncbi:MAG: hypothetical protein WCO25_03200 [Candidatus Uhrbacteria bacterium]